MLRVPVHKIEDGMVLARPVVSPEDPRRVLLQRDQAMTTRLIQRLQELGIVEVWIRNRNLEFLEDLIDESLAEQQRELYYHVRRNFETVMSGSAPQLDVVTFQNSILSLFDYLKRSIASSILLQKLDAFDNYLMSHSANVCYLSLLLGMNLEDYLISERASKTPRDAKDVKTLGLGALMHDLGKMKIPPAVLNKPSRLTPEEMAIMREHPRFGYELVTGNVPPAAAQVVLNHHQRYDGRGYPTRKDVRSGEDLGPLEGRRIPIFSRIATICDVYDAATTQRVYSPAKHPARALYEMRHWCKGFFDPVIERVFYRVIPPFPIGQMVKLSNGFEAAVVDFNPDEPNRPKVQCMIDPYGRELAQAGAAEVDLAMHPDLCISQVNGDDVTKYVEEPEPVELAGTG